jgi:hypothetical protein
MASRVSIKRAKIVFLSHGEVFGKITRECAPRWLRILALSFTKKKHKNPPGNFLDNTQTR